MQKAPEHLAPYLAYIRCSALFFSSPRPRNQNPTPLSLRTLASTEGGCPQFTLLKILTSSNSFTCFPSSAVCVPISKVDSTAKVLVQWRHAMWSLWQGVRQPFPIQLVSLCQVHEQANRAVCEFAMPFSRFYVVQPVHPIEEANWGKTT